MNLNSLGGNRNKNIQLKVTLITSLLFCALQGMSQSDTSHIDLSPQYPTQTETWENLNTNTRTLPAIMNLDYSRLPDGLKIKYITQVDTSLYPNELPAGFKPCSSKTTLDPATSLVGESIKVCGCNANDQAIIIRKLGRRERSRTEAIYGEKGEIIEVKYRPTPVIITVGKSYLYSDELPSKKVTPDVYKSTGVVTLADPGVTQAGQQVDRREVIITKVKTNK